MLALLSAGFIGSAQNKETRQERIERWKSDMAAFKARQAKDTKVYDVTDSIAGLQAGDAIKNASFVLEADAVTFRRGTRVFVNSTTNFISVRGDRAVVQVSPSYSYSGPNGVGGITVDGKVSLFNECDRHNDKCKSGYCHNCRQQQGLRHGDTEFQFQYRQT